MVMASTYEPMGEGANYKESCRKRVGCRVGKFHQRKALHYAQVNAHAERWKGLHTNGGGSNQPCEVRLSFDQQKTVPASSDNKERPEHDGYPGLG